MPQFTNSSYGVFTPHRESLAAGPQSSIKTGYRAREKVLAECGVNIGLHGVMGSDWWLVTGSG
jgi:hypothetical protein